MFRIKKENLSDNEIINTNTYQIAKKWNINDHNNRVKDGSITYDYFEASDKKVEYRISKCHNIEMFQYYGI